MRRRSRWKRRRRKRRRRSRGWGKRTSGYFSLHIQIQFAILGSKA
jgi:hypothetical protein